MDRVKKVEKMMRKNIKIFISVLLLVLVDQVIKSVISNNFMEKEFYFIDNILGFKTIINTKYSWINSIMNLRIGYLPHVIVNSIIVFLSIAIFFFVRERYQENKVVYLAFLLLIAGGLCSLIDKLFWGGSLDYILLKGFFVFDLKDVYISIFETIVVACLIFNYKGFRRFNEKKFYHDFMSYVKTKLLRLEEGSTR